MKKKLSLLCSFILTTSLLIAGCNNTSSSSNTASEIKNNGSQAASEKKLTIEEIANLKGPDREKILIEGAKKEGKLTWYSTLIIDQIVRPMVDGFQKKYPFIKVEYTRGNNSDLVEKVLNESRAKQYMADVVDGTETVLPLKKSNLLQPIMSPVLEEYPKDIKDPDRQWATINMYYSTIGYNTDMVPKDQVPKTYEDLLDPKWKGKMAWNPVGTFGGPGFVGNILKSYGEEKGMDYIKKLSQQKIVNMNVAARAVLDRSIAGEYPIALQIFNNHAVISAKKGAPVNWQPIEPVLASPNVIMLLKNAPNPYSALLFLDFVLNKNEGQKILQDADYIPAHPDVPGKYPELKPQGGKYKANFLTPEEIAGNLGNWSKIVNDYFMK